MNGREVCKKMRGSPAGFFQCGLAGALTLRFGKIFFRDLKNENRGFLARTPPDGSAWPPLLTFALAYVDPSQSFSFLACLPSAHTDAVDGVGKPQAQLKLPRLTSGRVGGAPGDF